MDFNLSDQQRELVEATRGLLTNKAPASTARLLADLGGGYDTELWQFGVEMGWPALALPESDGGLGLSLVELALVSIEQGHHLATTPLLPVATVADAVARSNADCKPTVLEALLCGTATAAWASAEFGQSAGAVASRAEPTADGFALSGAKVDVQDADSADWLLVDALLDGSPARFIVASNTAGIRIDPQLTLDVARSHSEVTFEDAVVPADALCSVGAVATADIVRSSHIAAVLACAELTGIGRRLLEMTVDYVGTRVQFGRPVGSFQAVKHKCADMRIDVQASTAATYYAAMAVAAGAADQSRAVSVAKAYVSDATNRVAGEALQLHGGIGFTWEHDLHLYLRRSRTLSLLYGSSVYHRELLCSELEAGGKRVTA